MVNKCSPIAQKTYKKTGSCIVSSELNNLLVKNGIIGKDKLNKISHKEKVKLLTKKSNCNEESCAINKLNTRLYKKYYKPLMPHDWYKSPNEWLSNYDIMNVLQQYEDEPKFNFKLLAISPIDWNVKINNFFSSECVTNELCTVNTKKIKTFKANDKWKLAIVFNTDTHEGSGKHWISLFVNMNERSKNYGIYYFDSNGNFKSVHLMDIINKLKEHIDEINKKPIKVFENKLPIQKTSSECGMYSLVFIIYMIKNKPFKKILETFSQDNIKDNHVFKYREILFNKL
jgi:hypothetical protein